MLPANVGRGRKRKASIDTNSAASPGDVSVPRDLTANSTRDASTAAVDSDDIHPHSTQRRRRTSASSPLISNVIVGSITPVDQSGGSGTGTGISSTGTTSAGLVRKRRRLESSAPAALPLATSVSVSVSGSGSGSGSAVPGEGRALRRTTRQMARPHNHHDGDDDDDGNGNDIYGGSRVPSSTGGIVGEGSADRQTSSVLSSPGSTRTRTHAAVGPPMMSDSQPQSYGYSSGTQRHQSSQYREQQQYTSSSSFGHPSHSPEYSSYAPAAYVSSSSAYSGGGDGGNIPPSSYASRSGPRTRASSRSLSRTRSTRQSRQRTRGVRGNEDDYVYGEAGGSGDESRSSSGSEYEGEGDTDYHEGSRTRSGVRSRPSTGTGANTQSSGGRWAEAPPVSRVRRTHGEPLASYAPTTAHPSDYSHMPPAQSPYASSSSHAAASVGGTTGSTGTKKRGNLPREVTELLKAWILAHADNPYPTDEEKRMLCAQTGLTYVQVSNWMINVRDVAFVVSIFFFCCVGLIREALSCPGASTCTSAGK